ncbi:MAG: hypothetical protein IPN74_17910 [Haliscomenobacter sp.]|nr:hypothetical protein [Haliscomenobacter sp.]
MLLRKPSIANFAATSPVLPITLSPATPPAPDARHYADDIVKLTEIKIKRISKYTPLKPTR